MSILIGDPVPDVASAFADAIDAFGIIESGRGTYALVSDGAAIMCRSLDEARILRARQLIERLDDLRRREAQPLLRTAG